MLIRLRVHEHRAGGGNGRDDINVPVRAELFVVSGKPPRNPHEVTHSDRALQLGLDLCFRRSRVAACIELDRLSEQDRALAINVNATALVDHA